VNPKLDAFDEDAYVLVIGAGGLGHFAVQLLAARRRGSSWSIRSRRPASWPTRWGRTWSSATSSGSLAPGGFAPHRDLRPHRGDRGVRPPPRG
jgi:hypothetical protein